MPRCRHGEDWSARTDRCCRAVQAGAGIFRPPTTASSIVRATR
jgi:hypothetical protein